MTGYIDLKARFYDPAIARFQGVDLLAESYPHNGVYNYAENRPINGIDLDGLEFFRTTDKNSTTIGARVRFENSSVANERRVSDIKREIQSTFNTVIGSANNNYGGKIIYDNKATLSIIIQDKGPQGNTGGTGGMGESVATNNDYTEGTGVVSKTVGYVANSAVHELLHNAGLLHPTDLGKDKDGKLVGIDPAVDSRLDVKFKNNAYQFSTNSKTAKNIFSNIMLYGVFNVNGKKVNSVRGSNENANTLTLGQLKIIEDNINKGRVNGESTMDQP